METSARLLRLLALFTSRQSWRADELAARMEVTTRTLRRDVARLRDLGYPVVSTTGRYGGYELGAGGRLPPLLLDDDEAIATSVALRELSNDADPTLGEAALSAMTKLAQVLPKHLVEQVAALGEVTVGVRRRRPSSAGEAIAVPVLLLLAMVCRRGERITFEYRDNAAVVTERRSEPHRLVSLHRRWYLVAFDLDRDDWRTYRVDRMTEVTATGHRNTPREVPDAAAQVAAGVAVHAYTTRATVRLHATVEQAASVIAPNIGVIEADPDDEQRSVVQIGGDADWIAGFLAGMPFAFEVVDSDDLRSELRVLARRLQRAATTS